MTDRKMVEIGGGVDANGHAVVYRTEGYGKTPGFLIDSLARRALRNQIGFTMESLGGFRVTYTPNEGIKSMSVKSWNARTEVKWANRVHIIELTDASMFSKVLGAWSSYTGFVSVNTVDAHGVRPTMKRIARARVTIQPDTHKAEVHLTPIDMNTRISESLTHFQMPRFEDPNLVIEWVRIRIAEFTQEAMQEWKVAHS